MELIGHTQEGRKEARANYNSSREGKKGIQRDSKSQAGRKIMQKEFYRKERYKRRKSQEGRRCKRSLSHGKEGKE